MKVDIGGDRLGSGSKETVHLKNFERSTHDLSYIWKSTAAPGTLIPFMTELALPGDTFNIDLNCDIMTHPTVGPLFGSYKIQLDVFEVPLRLYMAQLHNNELGIGMKMDQVLLPQIAIDARTNPLFIVGDNSQINPSCIFSYLGIRGIGLNETGAGGADIAVRRFNAIPYLGYAEIYKQYYANKQEELGVIIHNPLITNVQDIKTATAWKDGLPIPPFNLLTATYPLTLTFTKLEHWQAIFDITVKAQPDITHIIITLDTIPYAINQVFQVCTWDNSTATYDFTLPFDWVTETNPRVINSLSYDGECIDINMDVPQLTTFPLSNIDEMRKTLLRHDEDSGTFLITNQSLVPYSYPLKQGTVPNEPNGSYCKLSSQEGLFIKTYQSDLFNNWIQTEWIEGTNGINEITSIDTSSGSFTIDTLNLASKVYAMLNSIAISGGSYDDWLNAVYRQDRYRGAESPVYHGSLIKELAFEEITSVSASEVQGNRQALGTLAGKGKLTGKNKGGKIKINVQEPSYIMGIFSITPRIDYSQGNKWHMNLKNMNELHKPHLDAIGYQDLLTDKMAWWDTTIETTTNNITFKSAGKQPAWIDYMSNVNETRGNFAEENNEMFMTLNRRYAQNGNQIQDLTTYIDPTKFNHIFAQTSLDAQNFWVQIAIGMQARRKMSAKVIPNL